MADRLISVGDDLTLPASVVVPPERVTGLAAALAGKATAEQGERADAAVQPDVLWRNRVEDQPAFRRSTNLLNPAGMVGGFTLSATTGEPTVSAPNNLTDFLPVLPAVPYALRDVARWALYDATKAFISSGTAQSFAPPANARYARLVINQLYQGQMSQAATLPAYEPYWQEVPGLRRVVGIADTDFVTRSTNLVNPAETTAGFVIASGTATPSANAQYSVTNPIRVEPRSTYSYAGVLRITYLTAAGEFAGHLNGAGGSQLATGPVPANATHVRLSTLTVNLGVTAQMNAGATLLAYEPFWVRVSGRDIPQPAPTVATARRYLIDAPAKLGAPYTSPTLAADPDLAASTVTTVYGWWDALAAAHPTYITKADLGLSSDGVTQLRSYTLRAPTVPTTLGAAEAPMPAVLIIAGVHGYEKAAVHSAHAFAKALCETWQAHPTLEAIRWNAELVFVPVGNPHSYNGSTVSTLVRVNANGVDIARNFPPGWVSGTPGTETYGGTAPLSEPEAIILDTLMQAVASRCVLGVSLHNFSSPSGTPWQFLWNASATAMQLQLGKRLISMLSRKWRAEHTWITVPDTYLGYADMQAPGGSEGRQMAAYGINGATFETSRLQRLDGGAGTEHDSRALTLGAEAIANYVAMGLRLGVEFANAKGS